MTLKPNYIQEKIHKYNKNFLLMSQFHQYGPGLAVGDLELASFQCISLSISHLFDEAPPLTNSSTLVLIILKSSLSVWTLPQSIRRYLSTITCLLRLSQSVWAQTARPLGLSYWWGLSISHWTLFPTKHSHLAEIVVWEKHGRRTFVSRSRMSHSLIYYSIGMNKRLSNFLNICCF